MRAYLAELVAVLGPTAAEPPCAWGPERESSSRKTVTHHQFLNLTMYCAFPADRGNFVIRYRQMEGRHTDP